MKNGRKSALFLITKATWGGAQRYVFDLATHLSSDSYEVSVAFGKTGRLRELLAEKRIPLHRIPSLGRNVALVSDVTSFFQILTLLRRERPDVLHVNSSKAAALGALAARLCRVKKIVFTAHGWPFKENRGFFARALIHFVSWFTALCAHATVVVSITDREIGKRMWLVGSKMHYVPLGIETPNFLSREEARAFFERASNVPSIVTMAELTKNKGVAYALEAMSLLKNRGIAAEYFILGEGELRGQLEAKTRELGIEKEVHFLGFVENATRYLKAFDMYLLPSIKEGMPYVLLEASAAELPIVATSVIEGSSVQPGNAQALADAIEKKKTISIAVSSLDEMLKKTESLYLSRGEQV